MPSVTETYGLFAPSPGLAVPIKGALRAVPKGEMITEVEPPTGPGSVTFYFITDAGSVIQAARRPPSGGFVRKWECYEFSSESSDDEE